jgi:hypothetical protein
MKERRKQIRIRIIMRKKERVKEGERKKEWKKEKKERVKEGEESKKENNNVHSMIY